MNIYYDHQTFTLQKYGGISRYFASLIAELNVQGVSTKIIAPIYQNYYLNNDFDKSLITGYCVKKLPYGSSKVAMGFNSIMDTIGTSIIKPDIIHETYYFSKRRKTPTVITVHDMIHELFPNKMRNPSVLIDHKRKAVNNADHIICISEHTKKDLIDILDVNENKISVVYHGVDKVIPSKAIGSASVPIDFPYILYVGQRDGYKNFNSVVQAFSSSKRLHSNFKLIAFGGGSFTSCEINHFENLGLNASNLYHVEGDDDLLSSLYSKASVFVYPSIYEGFGLPPLEAMAHGCTVVASNTSCIPEILKDAAIYIEPLNIDSIIYGLEKALFQRNIDYINKGYELCSNYTWQKCAKNTMTAYKKII